MSRSCSTSWAGWLDTASFPATARGYRNLTGWVTSFGEVLAIGVEGTGSWGAGLSRHLRARGLNVIEVNKPNRHNRRRRGKTDPIDAEAAARAVLAGDATATPKAGDGPVEALRQLRVARAGAMKARTAAANQFHSICDTAPDAVRGQLRGLSTRTKMTVAGRYRAGDPLTPTSAAKTALHSIARRWAALDTEIRALDRDIKTILDTIAAPLLARHGVGYETAGSLLCAAGDNPDRLATEASFAALCGTSPVPVSSGRTNRHRLNRAGDRQANAALWRIVIVRLRKPTRAHDRLPRTTRHRRELQTRRHPMPQALPRPRALQRHPSHRDHDPTTISPRPNHDQKSPLDPKRRIRSALPVRRPRSSESFGQWCQHVMQSGESSIRRRSHPAPIGRVR